MKNYSKKTQNTDFFKELFVGSELDKADVLDVVITDNVCVSYKSKMTALEVAATIATLNDIASDLMVKLVAAVGLCHGCGDLNGRTPVQCVQSCNLCSSIFDDSQRTRIPKDILEEAGIPQNTKMEAYFDEDSGGIFVTEADVQEDITDLPAGLLSVLKASGVCLAEMDECIMQGEIVYGK